MKKPATTREIRRKISRANKKQAGIGSRAPADASARLEALKTKGDELTGEEIAGELQGLAAQFAAEELLAKHTDFTGLFRRAATGLSLCRVEETIAPAEKATARKDITTFWESFFSLFPEAIAEETDYGQAIGYAELLAAFGVSCGGAPEIYEKACGKALKWLCGQGLVLPDPPAGSLSLGRNLLLGIFAQLCFFTENFYKINWPVYRTSMLLNCEIHLNGINGQQKGALPGSGK
jgi:hypothetical protein